MFEQHRTNVAKIAPAEVEYISQTRLHETKSHNLAIVAITTTIEVSFCFCNTHSKITAESKL